MNGRELRAAIAHYDALHPSGGPLHIIIHDFNLRHSDLDFCWGKAAEVADGEAIAIVNALRLLDLPDRQLAVHPIACRNCGHSEVGHETRLSEAGSIWGTGPCTIHGCACGECDA